jgi:hypothetical protein
MKADSRLDKTLYCIGWCLIGFVLCIVIADRILKLPLEKHQLPCLFHSVTGFYCPGCGGTRAVKALLSFHILESMRYHPFVPYTAIVGGWFMVSQTIERLSQGKIRIALHYRDIYLWLAGAILLLNVLVKNILLAIWGVDLLY